MKPKKPRRRYYLLPFLIMPLFNGCVTRRYAELQYLQGRLDQAHEAVKMRMDLEEENRKSDLALQLDRLDAALKRFAEKLAASAKQSKMEQNSLLGDMQKLAEQASKETDEKLKSQLDLLKVP